MAPTVGTQLGGYRLEDVVGRGGMGVVYRATEVALDRPVALKLIAPELAGRAGFRERFLRESRLAASLDHPGILPVFAAGEADGELYLATRLVEGVDLGALADAEPLEPERALGLVGQVADALDAAHARNLVHRDVKPGNVLVDPSDHCYLCDFGLSKQLGVGATTISEGLAGSLDYLAPEQIRRDDVDGRTDQYALACVLYELLTGAPPFRRETEAQTLWAHMQEPPPAAAGYPELDRVFARALAKEPRERYDDCSAFVEDARAALGLGPSGVAVRRRRRRVGRRLLVLGAALVAAAIAAAMLALTLRSEDSFVAPPNSVALVDARSLSPVASVPVGNTPTETAASSRWVWVINSNDGAGTISRIDPRTRRVASTFSVGGTPRSIVAAFGSLWVGTSEGRVVRVDPGTDLIEKSWTLPNAGVSTAFAPDRGAGWVAAGPDAVWAASVRAVSRIDPVTGRLLPRESKAWGPLTYAFGSLWVLTAEGLERLSPRTMRRSGTTDLPPGFVAIANGFGSLWASSDETDAVLRIDPRREAVVRRYPIGGRPFGVAVGAGGVWAATEAGNVARIDPRTHAVQTVAIGGTPRNVAVGRDEVWISVD